MNRASSATGWVGNPDGTLGWTWNPITGCLNGCPYCYARKLANGRLKVRYLANTNVGLKPMTGKWAQAINDPFYPRFWAERLIDVPFAKKPLGIFVCDMSDLFGIGIPDEWTRKVMGVIKLNSQDRFYLLTKQPQNLIKWSPFPDNCWVGVTYTDYDSGKGFGWHLEQVEARRKFVSFEPLLGRHPNAENWDLSFRKAGISWVIIGAQTKPTVYPKIEWVEEIVRACDRAGVKVFLKYNLVGHIPIEEPFYKNDGSGWAIRQEAPR